MLTQYMASSLIKHLSRNWRLSGFGEYIEVVPAQMRLGEFWYRGTADAVYQNLNLVRDARPAHVACSAAITSTSSRSIRWIVPPRATRRPDRRRVPGAAGRGPPVRLPARRRAAAGSSAFVEKPANPPAMPGRPDWSLVSMGNYVFKGDVLTRVLVDDAADPASRHDFGKDIIPRLLAAGRPGVRVRLRRRGCRAIPPTPSRTGATSARSTATSTPTWSCGRGCRRWTSTTGAGGSDRRSATTRRRASSAPARASRWPSSTTAWCARARSSPARGCARWCSATTASSTPAPSWPRASVLSGCDIGAGCKLRRVILDKNCKIEPGTVIGYDLEADRERLPFVTDSGIAVFPKGTVVPAHGPAVLANDVAELIDNDPELRNQLKPGTFAIAMHGRHSYDSAGPRFQRFAHRPDEP
jgi:glucose-1-phosphate adenylyltransferase